MQRSVVLDSPYSNAFFLGAEKTLRPDIYKKEKSWAKQGSRYYQEYFSNVNARLIQDTYQILLMFDKVIIKPADFAVNTEFQRLKFIDMRYPVYRVLGNSRYLTSSTQTDLLDPLLVSLTRSIKEKTPIPVFASNSSLIRRGLTVFSQLVDKSEREIRRTSSSLLKEKFALNLVLDKIIPRVKVADFNHLLELREDPNLEPFKTKIWEFVQLLNQYPKREAIMKISREIDSAARSIRLPCYDKYDKLKAYSNIGLDIASFIPLLNSISSATALAKDLKDAQDVDSYSDYRWILFGRTRLRRTS
jgi:hypothetical protein